MLIPSFTEKLYKISRLMRKNGAVPLALTIVIALTMNPDVVYAGNFWDKVKDAAKKSQQQQQPQQPQQRSSSQPQKTSNANLPKFNIRGFYLGMSMKDALATLQNFNPPMKINEMEINIGMIDGARITGPRFMGGLSAGNARNIESFILTANTPQNAETVIGISRRHHLDGKPVLLSEMRDLFVKKYGSPVFEARPSVSKRNPFYIMSWSLLPNGKPQKDITMINHCGGKGKLGKAGSVMLTANVKARNNLNYQQCGFTFVVYMGAGNIDYSESATTYNYITTLYDGNEIRKSVNKTIAYTEKAAKKLDAENMEKLRGTKKPQL